MTGANLLVFRPFGDAEILVMESYKLVIISNSVACGGHIEAVSEASNHSRPLNSRVLIRNYATSQIETSLGLLVPGLLSAQNDRRINLLSKVGEDTEVSSTSNFLPSESYNTIKSYHFMNTHKSNNKISKVKMIASNSQRVW
jgi:hypothetical protein